MQNLSFFTWFTSLKMMFSRSIHKPANDLISLFMVNNVPLYICIYHIDLIHPSVLEHLGFSHRLAIVQNAVINMGVQVTLLYPDLRSFG
jgi:hypothetical protein